VVVHGGRRHPLSVSEVLTFGRADSCTICLDPADRGISRLAGSVEHEAGTWWVWNRSGVRALTVADDLGMRTVVSPGRRIAITGPVTVVVEGSSRRHALDIRADRHLSIDPPQPGEDGVLATATADEVIITELDRLALVALFAGYLEAFPRYDPHPRSYADAASALGWPRTTLVKRIEYLRVRLTNAGVPNLVGETALSHLAEWALTTRVLTRDDLALLGHA
jgi:hypothetical protein